MNIKISSGTIYLSPSEKAYEISRAADFPLIKPRQEKARSKVTAQSSDCAGVKSQLSRSLPQAPPPVTLPRFLEAASFQMLGISSI